MPHPQFKNRTGFAFEPLLLADEEGRPLLVPILKATLRWDEHGLLQQSPEQIPVNLGGEFSTKSDPSSYKYEPEVAFFKPATDVVMVGSAWATTPKTTELIAGMVVGPIKKVVRVVGDRYWTKRAIHGEKITDPEPFEQIPLCYERAFGGWDRSHPDPSKHTFDQRNPVGTGYRAKNGVFVEGLRLPNLEDPRHPIVKPDDRPALAGFGFISPDWQPRVSLAGTFDAAWAKQRKPLLPEDFDRRFLNAAPQDQIAPGYLRGDEPVQLVNVSPKGRLSFRLPGLEPPRFRIRMQTRSEELAGVLDTVVLNTDESLLLMIWRASLVLDRGIEAISMIEAVQEGGVFAEQGSGRALR